MHWPGVLAGTDTETSKEKHQYNNAGTCGDNETVGLLFGLSCFLSEGVCTGSRLISHLTVFVDGCIVPHAF